jgi:hypothetical protein
MDFMWGNANQVLEFTTTDNVAEFTAAAAVDENTPSIFKNCWRQVFL